MNLQQIIDAVNMEYGKEISTDQHMQAIRRALGKDVHELPTEFHESVVRQMVKELKDLRCEGKLDV